MRDERIEKWLASHGVTDFDYEDKVSLSVLDVEAGYHNQVRIGDAVKEEIAERYSIGLSSKNGFPPLVLRRKSNGKLYALDGNNRIAATIKLGWLAYPAGAYVVTCTDVQADILARTANTAHGLPLTAEERVHHAGQMVIQNGMSRNEASSLFTVSLHRVGDYVQDQEQILRMSKEGIKNPTAIAQTARINLAKIQSPALHAAAAAFAVSEKMSSKDADALADRVCKAPSEQAGLAIIESERKQVITAKKNTASPKSKPIKVYNNLRRVADAFCKITGDDLAYLSGEHASMAKDRIRAVSEWARELLGQLSKGKR